MNNETINDILNELLDLESRSVLPRLRESGVFVSWASADEVAAVKRMIDEDAEHRAWLIETLLALGGEPGPTPADIRATNQNYLDLQYVLPRALDDARQGLKTYEIASSHVSANALASETVGKITARHRRHVETLEKLTARAYAPTT